MEINHIIDPHTQMPFCGALPRIMINRNDPTCPDCYRTLGTIPQIAWERTPFVSDLRRVNPIKRLFWIARRHWLYCATCGLRLSMPGCIKSIDGQSGHIYIHNGAPNKEF